MGGALRCLALRPSPGLAVRFQVADAELDAATSRPPLTGGGDYQPT